MKETFPPILLSVQSLSIRFAAQKFEAVKSVNFELNKGETLAVVGESGSGKSLIALSLMGLQPKNAILSGDIFWHTENKSVAVLNFENKEWQHVRGRDFGMIFQEPMTALNPLISIGNQIAECISRHQNCTTKIAKNLALQWIEKVQIPTPKKTYNRYPHQLSGGQKQRVMIAMAMCNKPAVLIADEATTALDATVQNEVVQLMKNLQKETNTALIFITHDLALAANIADTILVMQKGELIEMGAANAVLKNPQMPYTQALLSCRPTVKSKGKKLPIIADFLNGNSILQPIEKQNTTKNEELLRVENLNIWYPEKVNLWGKTTQHFKAVNDVSFSIAKGETLGLVGESGCGKSTIGKSLMGLVSIHSGDIFFENKKINTHHTADWNTLRQDIQLIFQDPYASLNPRHTIEEIITEPLKINRSKNAIDFTKEAARLLSLVQLPTIAAKLYPHQFSGGQRQRIGIARALATQPKLLICDESVSALDVSIQAQILNLLQDLQSQLFLSYLFISHDLSVVHYIADKILVMQHGKIVESGTANDILLSPQNPYTQQLIGAMPVF